MKTNLDIPARAYMDRKDDAYLSTLLDLLDIDKLPMHDSKEPPLAFEIEYMGTSASTLLGLNDSQTPVSLYFAKLLSKEFTDRLKERNYKLKVRFLFPYPFSQHIYTVIKANNSIHWPTIEQIEYSFETEPLMTAPAFEHSVLMTNLRASLRRIEVMQSKNPDIGFSDPASKPHSIALRFSVNPLWSSYLRINSVIFTDMYVLQQNDDSNHPMFSNLPVYCFERDDNETGELYKKLLSQFSFLWARDTCIDFMDCTNYSKETPEGQIRNVGGLDAIKSFSELLGSNAFFSHKAMRIVEQSNQANGEKSIYFPLRRLTRSELLTFVTEPECTNRDKKCIAIHDQIQRWKQSISERFANLTFHPNLVDPKIIPIWPKSLSYIKSIDFFYERDGLTISMLLSNGKELSWNTKDAKSNCSYYALGMLLHLACFDSFEFIVKYFRGKSSAERISKAKDEILSFLNKQLGFDQHEQLRPLELTDVFSKLNKGKYVLSRSISLNREALLTILERLKNIDSKHKFYMFPSSEVLQFEYIDKRITCVKFLDATKRDLSEFMWMKVSNNNHYTNLTEQEKHAIEDLTRR